MNEKELLDKWTRESYVETKDFESLPLFHNWEEYKTRMKGNEELSFSEIEHFVKFVVSEHEQKMKHIAIELLEGYSKMLKKKGINRKGELADHAVVFTINDFHKVIEKTFKKHLNLKNKEGVLKDE